MRLKKNPDRMRRWKTVFIVTAAVALLAALLLLLLWPEESPSKREKPPAAARDDETLPVETRDAEAFYYEGEFLHYAAGTHRVGIDVSTHQGLIDWQAVREAGVEFAILRVGYRGTTQGLLYEDEQFRYNLESAKAAGIQVGAYFFSQALDEEEAAEEAEFVCALLEEEQLDLPVYFDWEVVQEEGTRVSSPQDVPLTDCALAFCRTVESHGHTAGVYFNQSFGYRYLELEQLQTYSLWLAEYGDAPTFRYHFDCLQYSDSGSIDGIPAEVDLDILFME